MKLAENPLENSRLCVVHVEFERRILCCLGLQLVRWSFAAPTAEVTGVSTERFFLQLEFQLRIPSHVTATCLFFVAAPTAEVTGVSTERFFLQLEFQLRIPSHVAATFLFVCCSSDS